MMKELDISAISIWSVTRIDAHIHVNFIVIRKLIMHNTEIKCYLRRKP